MSKISELSDGGSLLASDYLLVVRSGGNVKVRMDQINVDQVDLGDNEFIRLGNSQDLTMVHTSTQSIINQAGIGDLLIQKAGATKLTINASGIDVTGSVTADGLTVVGITTSSNGTYGTKLTYSNGNQSGIIDTFGNHNLEFRTNDDRAMNIASNGDISFYNTAGTSQSLFWDASAESLGIGTSSVATKLHVMGNSTVRNTLVSTLTLDAGISAQNPYTNFGTGIDFKGRDYSNAIRNYGGIYSIMIGNTSSTTPAGDAGFNSALTFYTNTGGASGTNPTEKMRLDASGTLLVGRTGSSGLGKLNVEGGADFTGGDVYLCRDSGNVSIGGTTGERLTVTAPNPTDGLVASLRNSGTSGLTGTKLWFNQNTVDNWNIGQPAGVNAFVFCNSTGSTTERMRIDASGNLLVGVSTAQSFSGVTAAQNFVTPTNGNWAAGFRNTTTTTPWGVAIDYTGANPNNYSSDFLYCSAGGLRFSVMSNGGIKNYQANDSNLSDRREKTNFSPAKSYLDAICAIPVQTFNYIDQNMEDDPSVTLGVVAQDVQTVAPELVMESNWGTEEDPKMRLSIYQTDLQYALMKCIQEQQATIEALTARIAALES